jgi:ATP-binding cassette, subfamily G (WHITE), member 2, SNQ2
MLDVIGAGAATSSKHDWYHKWINSVEYHNLQSDIDKIHFDARIRPPVLATLHSEFATSWMFQNRALLIRNFKSYWRNPVYLMSKLSLNVIGGLFIGFTFWKSNNTLQGSQNKLFVSFDP